MKIITGLIGFMLMISSINAQSLYTVPYYNWSSKTSFMLSPSPVITGYGFLSDSLSRAHNDSTFYVYNNEYYPITCWADYYLWYVNKYWYHFEQPELYEYYYFAKDDYGMTQYICGNNFIGPGYPGRIAISFPGRSVYKNNLSYRKVKRHIKNNSWENKQYVATIEPDNNQSANKRILNRTHITKNGNSKNINNQGNVGYSNGHKRVVKYGNAEVKTKNSDLYRSSNIRNTNLKQRNSSLVRRSNPINRSSLGSNNTRNSKQAQTNRTIRSR